MSNAVAGGHVRRTLNLVAAVCGSAYSAHLIPWPLDGTAVGRRRVAPGCCSPASSCCAAAVASSSNQLVMDTRTPAWLTSLSGGLCHASPLSLPLSRDAGLQCPGVRQTDRQTDRQTVRQAELLLSLAQVALLAQCPGLPTAEPA